MLVATFLVQVTSTESGPRMTIWRGGERGDHKWKIIKRYRRKMEKGEK